MSKMFDDKKKSFFANSKPRMVDGCCEPYVCCGQDPCEYRLYYRVFDGFSLGPGITITDRLIDLDIWINNYQIVLYIEAVSGDIDVTSILAGVQLNGNWVLDSVPFTVTEGNSAQLGVLSGLYTPGTYITTVSIETSCGNDSVSFEVEVINNNFCLYDIEYSLHEIIGGIRQAAIESGTILWSPAVPPNTLTFTNPLTILLEYEVVFSLVPVAGAGPITATSASAGGNFSPLVDSTPIVVPEGVPTEVITAKPSTATVGAKIGTVGITTGCANDFSYEINYNVTAP